MLSIEDAHKATGMKRSEIAGIEAMPGGYRVHTIDGQHIDLEVVEDEAPAETPDMFPRKEDFPPDGSADEVMKWVGEDAGRAALALAAEQKKESPRSTLVAKLEKLAG